MSSCPDVSVVARSGRPDERDRVALLQLLRQRYAIQRFERTTTVIVESGVIPHSHPVLTVNTRPDSDDGVLATYLHEQLHWWSMECPGATDGRDVAVYDELMRRYSPLPVGPPDNFESELSALIHFHVCWLEHEALVETLGAARAAACLRSRPVYPTVYDLVHRDHTELSELFTSAGMGLPEADND